MISIGAVGYAVSQARPAELSRSQRRAAVVASTPTAAPMRVHGALGARCNASTSARSFSLSPSERGGPAPTASSNIYANSYLNISMQAQQKSNWCWDASGNTVADWWGHELTQVRFCQIAHNESGSDCANKQGYLSDQQRVYRWLGFSSSGY